MGSLTFQLMCACLVLTQNKVSSDSSVLRDIGDRFFDWRMQERPLQATKRNIHVYNDKLQQFSLLKMEEDKIRAEEFANELSNLNITDLNEEERVVYSILEDMIDTFIWGYQYKDYALNPVDFLTGLHRNPKKFVEEQPFHTIGDYQNYIARLREIPNQLRQFDTLMLEAIRRNKTLHINSIEPVLDQIESFLKSDLTKSVFFQPFEKLKDSDIPRRQWSDLRTSGYEAVRIVVGAYRQFRSWIKQSYIPRTRKKIAVDKEYYEACLRWHTSTNMTPEVIHRKGLEEVDRIQNEINQIFERRNFSGNLGQFFESLSDDPQYFKTDPDDVLEEFRFIINERIAPILHMMVKELPRFDLRIIPMPSDGPAGRYSPPSSDGRIPGTFLVNVLRPQEMPVFTFMSLAIHEAYPGHHLQISLAMSENTPDFMKYKENPLSFQIPFAFPSYSAFIEGWALYAESVGEEFGLFKDDLEMIGRYRSELFRAGRLVVDTGIHYYGWSREEAIDYLYNLTGKTRPFVEVEIDRYITWPGQACSYKIGEMAIKELKEYAEQELGDKFDIREFHSAVLTNGYKPLTIMSQTVRHWVDSNKERSSAARSSITVLSSLLIVASLVVLL